MALAPMDNPKSKTLEERLAEERKRVGKQSVSEKFAQEFSGIIKQPGALERIQEARPEEIAQLVQRRKEMAEGLTAPQYSVARQQMMSQQGAAEQQAMRQLARQQTIAGLRGGAATRQSSRLAQQLAQQRAQAEQGLFMADVGEKQRGLAALEQTLGTVTGQEQQRQLFNIEQQQREQLAQQARDLTIAQLAQASALGERQAQAAEYYAQQMAGAAGGRSGGGILPRISKGTAKDIAVTGALSAFASPIAGGAYAAKKAGCCFIFLEARYGNGVMDSVVRRYRDEFMTEQNRRGYYKVAEVLVPLMRKYKPVKWAVQTFMTDPLVAYGKAYYGTGSKLGFIFKPVKDFWLTMFEYIGGEHEFIRENGEIV